MSLQRRQIVHLLLEVFDLVLVPLLYVVDVFENVLALVDSFDTLLLVFIHEIVVQAFLFH